MDDDNDDYYYYHYDDDNNNNNNLLSRTYIWPRAVQQGFFLTLKLKKDCTKRL